jgi:hypothetical protein
MISRVVTHADLPTGTPFLVKNATLTNSPPTYEGVVCVTNSPASLADIMLLVELTSRPINSLIKYLKRNACNMIFPITDAIEAINGIRPTANISLKETLVNRNIISSGTTLAGIASSFQFKRVRSPRKDKSYSN